MENKISIIVPVYNLQEYIEKTIQSILKQTYKNIEIIVVDDGSTDNTSTIIDEYSQKDNRIIIIHKNNEGVSKARIRGIKESTGDYIGFVDGDDIIEPNMFELLLKNAVEYDADISHCGYVMDFPDGHSDFYYNTKNKVIQNNFDGLYDLVEGKFIEPGLWNKIYKRDIVLKAISSGNMDYDIKIYEDFLLNYLFFKESNKSVYEDVCLYHYTLRKSSAATSITRNKFTDPLKVTKIMSELNDNNLLYEIIYKRYIYVLINNSCQMKFKDIKKQNRLFLKNELKNFKKNKMDKKITFMSIGVVYLFPIYMIVRKTYDLITGNNKKYDV